MVGFCEEDVKCFDDIIEHQKPNWMYRGQREAEWTLKTSLERYCMGFYGDLKEAQEREEGFMREFRRRYHHYSIHIPQIDMGIEWLSLMHHHGAPTRLLDWTYSIYVALYFAIEKQSESEDHAVWAMDVEWCIEEGIRVVRRDGKAWEHLEELITEDNEQLYSETFLKPPYLSFAYPLNPFRLSERLVLQKGVFLIPGDVSKSFQKNLCSLQGYDDKDKFVKLKVPTSLRKDFLEKLNQMRITRANLFPGLGGFAQSLGVYPPPPALGASKGVTSGY